MEQFFGNQLFEGLEYSLLKKITPKLGLLRFDTGDIVFHEGDPADALYLIGEGSVKISKLGRGGQQETLGFIRSGSFFGEMSLLDGQPRSAMATAAEPTVLATMNEQTFQHVLELAPSRLHMNFLRSVTERLRNVNAHFINEVMRSERLSLVGAMANAIIHDLKNPISIVRSCSDLIASKNADPRVHELTDLLNKAVQGMLSMTQELLDYARGSTSFVTERVSIWRLLDELNEQAFRLLPGKNIQFVKHINYDGELEIDVARFSRMLCNLIRNSREAMPHGGILTFTTDLDQDRVSLRISDTGFGIPADLLPKLFEPFVTHGKKRGTGLGLAIAKSIVEAHQGKISISSVHGSGTTVDIQLPKPGAMKSGLFPSTADQEGIRNAFQESCP